MTISQSVIEMQGVLPGVFTPGRRAFGIGLSEDISLARVSITRGVFTSRAHETKTTVHENIQGLATLTLEIVPSGETGVSLPDIPFTLTGDPSSEVVFNSEGQDTPWKFLLSVNSQSRQMTLRFTLDYSGLSVTNALAEISFYEAMVRGGEFKISGSHPLTGQELPLARGKLPPGLYESADPRFVELLENLAFIENKTAVSFTIPKQSIKKHDVQATAETAEILRTGRAQYQGQPWVSISTIDQARNALESFADERAIAMALTFEGQIVSILGVDIPLGPVTLFCARSYVAKGDLVTLRNDLDAAIPGSTLSIRFTPFENCPVEARYSKWLSKDEADAIAQLPLNEDTELDSQAEEWTASEFNADAAKALLQSWYHEDVDQQKSDWEKLKAGLDEDRLSERKLFQ